MTKLQEFMEGKSYEEVVEILSQKPYCCEIKEDEDYPKYFLIKYSQINSDFHNEIVRECRGIIVRKSDYQIMCRPFDKFGNYGEGYVPDIDIKSAYALEKIDGSLIKVWYAEDYGYWMISTNGTIDAFKAELQNDLSPYNTFGEMFEHVFQGEQFKYLNKNHTYLFEVVSPWNRVVVQYKNEGVYHLATRCTDCGVYVVESLSNVQYPNYYPMNSLEQVVQMAKDLPFNNEGYVVLDKHYNRMKVKSPAYVAAHHLKNNGVITKKRLVDLILLGEDAEFLNYFPEYSEAMGEIQDLYITFMEKLGKDIEECKVRIGETDGSKEQRKEFAMWATKTTYPGLMFAMLDGHADPDDWKPSIHSMPSEKLLNIMMRSK